MIFVEKQDRRASQQPDVPREYIHAVDFSSRALLPLCASDPAGARDLSPGGRYWDCPFCRLIVQRRFGMCLRLTPLN